MLSEDVSRIPCKQGERLSSRCNGQGSPMPQSPNVLCPPGSAGHAGLVARQPVCEVCFTQPLKLRNRAKPKKGAATKLPEGDEGTARGQPAPPGVAGEVAVAGVVPRAWRN